MFVDIENFKSAIAVENILTPYKKGRLADDKKTRLPKEPITPDVCMEVLKSTNYARNIKDMLLCIAELPASEQAQFKEVVLSVFDQREQPNDILILGKKLAVASGFEDEFNAHLKMEEGAGLCSSPNKLKIFVTNKERVEKVDLSDYHKLLCLTTKDVYLYEHKNLPSIIDAPYSSKVSLANVNLCGVQKIIPQNGGTVVFTKAKNYPQNLDLSTSGRVCVGMHDTDVLQTWNCARENLVFDVGYYYFSGEVDLSYFDEVRIAESSFADDANLQLCEGSKLFITHSENLPTNLDVAQCAELTLQNCDLKKRTDFVFRDGAKVDFSYSKNLPDELDFSHCDEVDLSGCNLEYRCCPIFKKGAKVRLNHARNLSGNIDFSPCSELDMKRCSLSLLPNTMFAGAHKVDLEEAQGLPQDIDFSHCDDVNLENCDLDEQSRLRFKEGARVNLAYAKNLPEDTDVACCNYINLCACDLSKFRDLHFKDGAVASLFMATNLLMQADVSRCAEINLSLCDLQHFTFLRFRDGAKVKLDNTLNLPKNIDFSNCSEVDLSGCNLERQSFLSFMEGAKVNLCSTTLNARVLDVSKCDTLTLELCNATDAEKIIFKDKEQVAQSKLELPKRWKGHIIFTDETENEAQAKNGVERLIGKIWGKGGR